MSVIRFVMPKDRLFINVQRAAVVHCKQARFDVYIGRPSKWGNPFSIGEDGTRIEVIEKYRKWIQNQPELIRALPELKAKVLGCWCAPDACHGDILAELANPDTNVK